VPLVRINLRAGRSLECRKSLGEGVHRAMIEALAIPPDDRFPGDYGAPAGRTRTTGLSVVDDES
jgi:Tautomerase enzyme